MPETIRYTVLPGGVNAGKAIFSVILTPNVTAGDDIPAVFRKWPTNSAALSDADWTLQIKRGPVVLSQGSGKPISERPNESLWNELLDKSLRGNGKIPVRPRKGAEGFLRAWLHSHDAHLLHVRHDDHRFYHAAGQVMDANNLDDGMNTRADVDTKIEETAPRNVYLFPEIGSGGDAIARAVANRDAAIAFRQARLASAPINVRNRIAQGQEQLEQGERLTGLALMALYRICAESAHREDPAVLGTLVLDIDQASARLRDFSPALYIELQHYVAFHLTRTRPQRPTEEPTPDFHQLLGMLNQYPALLRPLGFVFDFQFELNAAFAGDGLTTAVTPPTVMGVTPEPLVTACTQDFFAAGNPSIMNFHMGRFLNLQLKSGSAPVYEIVTEDADGSAYKLAHQAASRVRSVEYRASVPSPNNGLGLADDSQIPSARTAGIALYQINRASVLGDKIAATPSIATPPALFYMEDLTLGYRVDVRGENWPSWMSLHERESNYEVGDRSWNPSGTSLAPDEGFLTMAVQMGPVATQQGAVAANGEDLQLFVHQSLTTWFGWSLSVPREGQSTEKPGGKDLVVAVHPTYRLRSLRSLPKLRFDTTYVLRLRQVDLAGNSLAVSAASVDGAELIMASPFSRHEPVRAPQILIEQVIDRKKNPGDQADRLVVRDHGPQERRMLVPPRETRQVLEFHGSLEDERLPESAFRDFQLTPNGTFPSVSQAANAGLVDPPDDLVSRSAEYQDAIILRRRDLNSVPYLPDPMARFVRIEPFVLQQNLSKFVPWTLDEDVKNSGATAPRAYYLDSQWVQAWPNVSPIRIVARSASRGTPLRIQQTWMSRDIPGGLPTVPVLFVDIPEGWTVALRLSSAVCLEPAPDEVRRQFREDMSFNAPRNRHPIPDELPQGGVVNLRRSFLSRLGEQPANFRRILVAAGGDGPIVANPAVAAPAGPPQGDFHTRLSRLMRNVSHQTFVCGTTHYVTPPRVLTLVHALKQPVTAADVAMDDRGHDLFSVKRALGESVAAFDAEVAAHWLSTGKVTCRAKWIDTIDDPAKSDLQQVPGNDVLEFVNRGGRETSGKLTAGNRILSTQQYFRTTRAHKVTYSFSATTRFREYYADNMSQLTFTRDGTRAITFDVLSSVAPPEPSIAYVVPAYSWKDVWNASTKTWKRGRTMVMRAYLHRPFLVSGNEECLGVVLWNGQSGGTTVTEWGRDPIVVSDHALTSNHMKASDFSGGTVVAGCFVQAPAAPGVSPVTVDVLPFPVEFSRDRGMWFCDIPFCPTQTPSAFVRLALVRWQPKALASGDHDVRLSTIVIADFLQLGPDRWVSVKKITSKQYSVTVSGVFRTPQVDSNGEEDVEHRTITYVLEQKWHQVGKDMGWRPVSSNSAKFKYSDITPPATPGAPAPDSPPPIKTGEWTRTIDLPRSTSVVRYRLLLTEQEWLDVDKSKVNTGTDADPPKLRSARTTYLHHIEL